MAIVIARSAATKQSLRKDCFASLAMTVMDKSIPEVRLDDLYQEVILDHNRRPRNFGKLEGANAYSHGYNPLCGDDYHVYLKIAPGDTIESVKFEGQGCAISKSSASMMTAMIEGKSIDFVQNLTSGFVGMLTKDEISKDEIDQLGRLKIFEGVKQYPVRVKCATLAWHALQDAIKDYKSVH